MTTSIQWTDETWNPIRARNLETGRVGWHCERISEGCRNCYAEQKNLGFFQLGTGYKYNKRMPDEIEVFLDEETLLQPLHWKKPRKVFPCSMTDWAGAWVPDEWMDKLLAVVALCPQHTFLFLTKRAERLPRYLINLRQRIRGYIHGHQGYFADILAPVIGQRALDAAWVHMKNFYHGPDEPKGIGDATAWPWPLPNVWLGVSAEDQATFDNRWGWLRQTEAAHRWLSLEPMIASINVRAAVSEDHYNCDEGTDDDPTPAHRCWPTTDWIVLGGESGSRARAFDFQWARDIINQCKAAQTPVFVKQLGAFPYDSFYQAGATDQRIYLKDKKGGDINEWSPDLQIREFPQ